MLTMSLQRLSDLLDKAAEVDPAEAVLVEESDEDFGADEILDESDAAMADDPAYQEFVDMVESLSQDEIDEILALGLLARNEAAADDWQTMLAQARALPEQDRLDEIVRMLLLTDEIEAALDRLGYDVETEEGEDFEDEEEGDDQEKDKGKTEGQNEKQKA